jgi:hypothetical protein
MYTALAGVVVALYGLGLAKRVHGLTRLQPVETRDPFSLDPDTTRLINELELQTRHDPLIFMGHPTRPVNPFKLNGSNGSTRPI